MKTKTKMIIALSLAGVITLGAVIALVVVIASFNATAGSGLSVSYVAKNVEAEVSMGYVVNETDTNDPKSLTYTTVQSGSNDKLTFSSSDTAETVSKSFDGLDEIELTKDGYVYLKYTFKHTGTTANSQNYLNVTLTNTFSTPNNIEFEYALYDSTLSNSSISWMAGINGITVTRDIDNECILFVRLFVDVKTQNALLDGSIVWSMTTSDSYYYANTDMQYDCYIIEANKLVFGNLSENLSNVTSFSSKSMAVDGSGPVTLYWDPTMCSEFYILSEVQINTVTLNSFSANFLSLRNLDVSNLNTEFVTDASHMFQNSTFYPEIIGELSKLNLQNFKNMSYMFSGCIVPDDPSEDLADLFSAWDTSNVTNMSYMFERCGFTNLDLSSLETSNVTLMTGMFTMNTTSLTTIDVSGFNTSKVTHMNNMFYNCVNLTTIYSDADWNVSSVIDDIFMFYECNLLVGGNGTSVIYGDSTYAKIDTAGSPGAFTLKIA